MLKDLTFITKSSWEDVFSAMKAHESGDPYWEQYAREVKGFASWEQWRRYQAQMLDMPTHDWEIYELEKPLETVPNFRVGPFQGWQKLYTEPKDKNKHTFAEFVQHHTVWVRDNVGVRAQMDRWPAQTMFIGLLFDDNSIVLFEGHHRATALALSLHDGKPLHLPKLPKIALARYRASEKPLLDAVLAKGSVNPLRVDLAPPCRRGRRLGGR